MRSPSTLTALPRLPLALPASPNALVIVGYLAGYLALDWISYVDPVPPLGITPWNPPPGLSLALLLRFGPRFGPWLFFAAALAEWAVRGATAPLPMLAAGSAVIALAYTGLATALLGPLRLRTDLQSVRDVVVFIAAAAITTGATALTFVGLFDLAGRVPTPDFQRSVMQFWIGDLIGILVTTPVLLMMMRPPASRNRVDPRETALQVVLTAAVLAIAFGSDVGQERHLFFLLFLPLVWIAMRHGLPGAALATLAVQIALVAVFKLGGSPPGAIVEFQFLLLALAITGLTLGAAVSERRVLERQLFDKQAELDRSLRLAATSELASALAHELNQPLTAIQSYVAALRHMLARPDEAAAVPQTMDKVVGEVDRAARVVRRLREFFRGGDSARTLSDVVALLGNAADHVRARLERHQVALYLDVAAGLPTLHVDRVQIEIVLLNLVGNAIDAQLTQPVPGRRVRIAAESTDFGVRISVDDAGTGLAPDLAATLFQPLASAKAGGMGLGLAICRTLVEAHGGRIGYAPLSPGSRFWFELPVEVE